MAEDPLYLVVDVGLDPPEQPDIGTGVPNFSLPPPDADPPVPPPGAREGVIPTPPPMVRDGAPAPAAPAAAPSGPDLTPLVVLDILDPPEQPPVGVGVPSFTPPPPDAEPPKPPPGALGGDDAPPPPAAQPAETPVPAAAPTPAPAPKEEPAPAPAKPEAPPAPPAPPPPAAAAAPAGEDPLALVVVDALEAPERPPVGVGVPSFTPPDADAPPPVPPPGARGEVPPVPVAAAPEPEPTPEPPKPTAAAPAAAPKPGPPKAAPVPAPAPAAPAPTPAAAEKPPQTPPAESKRAEAPPPPQAKPKEGKVKTPKTVTIKPPPPPPKPIEEKPPPGALPQQWVTTSRRAVVDGAVVDGPRVMTYGEGVVQALGSAHPATPCVCGTFGVEGGAGVVVIGIVPGDFELDSGAFLRKVSKRGDGTKFKGVFLRETGSMYVPESEDPFVSDAIGCSVTHADRVQIVVTSDGTATVSVNGTERWSRRVGAVTGDLSAYCRLYRHGDTVTLYSGKKSELMVTSMP